MRNWILLGIAVLALSITVIVMRLHPPQTLTLAAGPPHGGYYQVALRYKEILERDGLTLNILETAGSLENIDLLEERQADAAIVQGGVTTDDGEIEAIASIFFEPLIPLVRADADIPANPSEWRDLRINSGTPGSGTFGAFRDLQRSVRLAGNANEVLHYGYTEAVQKLISGELDIALFVAPIDAPYLQDAFWHPDLRVLQLDYIDAISRRLSYADMVDLPAGAISLHRVIPKEPKNLLALDARLAVSPELHPALVNRLALAAVELHSARGLINDAGHFPAIQGTDMPVNNVARQLILEGPSTWHDWLPFWLAAQINRMLLLLVPFFLVLVPALRAVPTLYSYLMGWQVWQHYPAIREIEEGLEAAPNSETLHRMEKELNLVDERLSRLRLPAAYRQGAYDARLHIDLVRRKIEERLQQVPTI